MKKGAFWKADWFLGLIIVIVVLVFNRVSDLIPSLERKAYDLGVKATSKIPSDKIAVIAIDDQSISNIGRWPWSREVHAKMIDKLADAWNRRDWPAFGRLFAEDADYVTGAGIRLAGRDRILEVLSEQVAFSVPDHEVTLAVESVKVLPAEVASVPIGGSHITRGDYARHGTQARGTGAVSLVFWSSTGRTRPR